MGLADLTEMEIERLCNQKSRGRGRTYYRTGRVAAAKWDGTTLRAKVRGARMYTVEIEDDNRGNFPYYCTCPYDWGGACKHVVAVLLHVLDHGAELFRSAREAHAEVESMLEAAAPAYALKFLAAEMEADPLLAKRFGEGIMWDAAAGADHRRRIDALFSRSRSRTARRAGDMGGGVDLGSFIAVARKFERIGDHKEAARVYGQIVEVAAANSKQPEARGAAVRESIEGTGRCGSVAEEPARAAGARIRAMLARYRDAHADLRGDHEAALLAACGRDGGMRRLLAAVAPHVPRSAAAGPSRRTRDERLAAYDAGRMLGLKAIATEETSGGAAAEKVLKGHGSASAEAYAMYSDSLLRAGQGKRALKIAREGIGRFGGDGRLVEAALGALGGDGQGRRALLEALYLESHDAAHVERLRKEDGWPASRGRIIAELEKDKKRPENLVALLVKEGMYKRALRALAASGDADLFRRHEAIGGRLPRSYLLAYWHCIEREAARAGNQQAYDKVADHLLGMARASVEGAGERARELAEELRKKYPRKEGLVAVLASMASII